MSDTCPTCGWQRDSDCPDGLTADDMQPCPDCGKTRPVYHDPDGTSGFIPPHWHSIAATPTTTTSRHLTRFWQRGRNDDPS